MLKKLGDKCPKIHPSAYINETAYIVGDVEIGAESSIWPGVVIRGDYGSIRVGKRTNIQDNAVLHADDYLIIGDDVTVGHSAVVHCHKIGNNVLIGINSTLLGDVGIPGKIRHMKEELKSRVTQTAINYRRNAKRYKDLK